MDANMKANIRTTKSMDLEYSISKTGGNLREIGDTGIWMDKGSLKKAMEGSVLAYGIED